MISPEDSGRVLPEMIWLEKTWSANDFLLSGSFTRIFCHLKSSLILNCNASVSSFVYYEMEDLQNIHTNESMNWYIIAWWCCHCLCLEDKNKTWDPMKSYMEHLHQVHTNQTSLLMLCAVMYDFITFTNAKCICPSTSNGSQKLRDSQCSYM